MQSMTTKAMSGRLHDYRAARHFFGVILEIEFFELFGSTFKGPKVEA